MITIIDYEAGNLKSVSNMLDFLGCEFKISSDAKEIENAEKLIFPGQGNFEQAMKNLTRKNLVEPIKNAIAKDTKFLGICLGLQLLFEKSEEAPNVNGLSIIKGEVKKFRQGKIPQIGWNQIKTTDNNSFLKNDYYYFVNSYYVVPQDFFFNDTATTEIYTLSLHDALPIWLQFIVAGVRWGLLLRASTCNCASVILLDRKSTRLNSSHQIISYAVFCLK